MAGTNVTVCIRLRPFLAREKPPAVVQVNGNTVRIKVETDQLYGAPEVEDRQFVFDSCLGQEVNQLDMYAQLGEPILVNVLGGFSGALFAYGQTGSGKTYSVMGSEGNPGLIPQLTKRLFEVVDADPREEPAVEIRIGMSFLEIYNEEIKDLLDPRPRRKKLYVHAHPKLGVYVPHLTEAAATSAAECIRLLDFGAKIRATAQTNMNSTSSRSHSVMTLRITQVFAAGKMRNSCVNLCDLAGSERAKKTGAQGKRMREGSAINNSLSVLGQVISKLAAGAERKGVHVPFRQSKLTHLLTDALSGNSVTTMLANVSPAKSEWEESLSTLRFAESVKKVKTNPQLTELAPEEPAMLLESFRSEIGVLQEALQQEGTLIPKAASTQLARAIEAGEHLMDSFAKRAGPQWAEAVEQTRALEAVQKQLLEDLRLPMQEVGQVAGVDAGTPYLLNISDDPALSGCLLYFLRAEPEVSTIGQAGPDSIAANSIVLTGLGIPARLCELHYRAHLPERPVIIRKADVDDASRLLVNGRPLAAGSQMQLKHGDRLVFGWAFCFRLIIGGAGWAAAAEAPMDASCFESVTKEVLEYTMTTTMGGMAVMKSAAQWQRDLMGRNSSQPDVEQVLAIIGELMVAVEEANVLCSELHKAVPDSISVQLDVGMTFGFLTYSQLPSVVAQVWKFHDDSRQLLAVWPAEDFDRCLVRLRDVHHEVLRKGNKTGSRWAFRLSSEEWWAGQAVPTADSDAAGSKASIPPLASEEDSEYEDDLRLQSMSGT